MSEQETDPLAPLRATFAGVVANLTNPKLDAKGAHGAKYTSLDALQKHLRPACREARIAITHRVDSDVDSVTTTLIVLDIDTGDQMEMGSLTLPYRDAQQMGGATTYAKRYTLTAAFGVAGDLDDDGRAASAPSRRPGNASNDQPSTVRPAGEISAAQLKALQTRYNATPRAERLEIWAGMLGRTVASAKELTKAEAIILLTEDAAGDE